MSKYVITKTDSGDYQFTLEAENGHTIFTSEYYSTKKNCKTGISAIQDNALNTEHYERKKAEDDKSYFVFKTQKGYTVGSSQEYKSESGFENAIVSLMKSAPNATIDDQSIESRN